MYALIQNNEIVKVFANPQGFTLNGNQYSSQIFQVWTTEEKQAIGIYEIETDSSKFKDESYYNNTNEIFEFKNGKAIRKWGTATAKQLEDVNATDEDGELIIRDGKQVVIKGLKSQKISISKQQTAGLLQSTDWYVTRKSDTGTAIPQEIQDFRTEVRIVSNQQETQINACTTVEQLKSLYEYTNTGTEQSPIYTRKLAEFPKTNRD
jgi:hypothetical protein